MDQKTIVTGLMHALEKGSGELDDLEALLDRAKADIATAKAEQEKRKEEDMKKRAENIANMATRLLHDELTADDVATVLTSYFNSKGHDVKVTAKAVDSAVEMCDDVDESVNEFCDAIAELLDTLGSVGKKYADNKEKPVKSEDNTIDAFLKSIGVR